MTETTPRWAGQKSNTIPFAELLSVATELGKQAGQGRDVQIKFDLKVLEAALHGALDIAPNKHGPDVDDATKLAEAYVLAQGSATIFDAKAPNQRKLRSNITKMIRLGMWPKAGGDTVWQSANNLMATRQSFRKDPIGSRRLEDAHNCLMRYATRQLKRDSVIGDDEFETFCFKAERRPRTAEQVIKAVRKTLYNLKIGKAANCREFDNSQELQDTIDLCTRRLAMIGKAEAPQRAAKSSAAREQRTAA
jgi:hypothetical protein